MTRKVYKGRRGGGVWGAAGGFTRAYINAKKLKGYWKTAKGITKRVKQAVRGKGNGSNTKTKTYGKKECDLINVGDLSHSYVKTKAKYRQAPRGLKFSAPASYWVQNGQQGAWSQLNLQGVSNIQVFGNGADLTGWAAAAYQSMPQLPAAHYENFKILLNEIKCDSTITNQSVDTIQMLLIDVIAKNNQTAAFNPATSWESAVTEMAGVESSVNSFNYPGNVPWRYPHFNQNFWIKKIKRITLAPGGYHNHIVQRTFNKIYDNSLFEDFSSIRGVTTCTMVVFQGMPHDSSTTYNAIGNIALTPVKIVWNSTWTIKARPASVTSQQEWQNTTLPSTITNLYGIGPSQNLWNFATAIGTTTNTAAQTSGLGA